MLYYDVLEAIVLLLLLVYQRFNVVAGSDGAISNERLDIICKNASSLQTTS